MNAATGQTLTYLRALYPEGTRGYVSIFTLEDATTAWMPLADLSAVEAKIEQLAQTKQVYEGVCPRDKATALMLAQQAEDERARRYGREPKTVNEASVRGNGASVTVLTALYCEVDIAAGEHAQVALPQTLDDALAFVRSLPLQPTMIVFSGGGLHLYWCLSEPWQLDGQEARSQAQKLLKRWELFVQKAAAVHGWRLDSVSDLARMLRPAGTWNRKAGAIEVQLLATDGPRYERAAFQPLLPEDQPAAPKAPTMFTNGRRPKVDLLLAQALRLVCEGRGRDNSCFHLACQARDNGFSREEADVVALAFQEHAGPYNARGQMDAFTLRDALKCVEQAYRRPAREPWGTRTGPEQVAEPATANGTETNDRRLLPNIMVSNRDLPDVTADALRALEAANVEMADDPDAPALYVRAGKLTRVRADEKGLPIIEELPEAALHGRMARTATWTRLNNNGEPVRTYPPMRIVRDVASLGSWPMLPALKGVTQAPVLRPDGSVLVAPGFDRATGLLYLPGTGPTVPAIPERPTADDMMAAQVLVRRMLQDFPFGDNASRANYLAHLLTGVLRPAIAGPTPLCSITAPQAGSGKTLLAEINARIITGTAASMVTAPREDAEWEKMITATLLEGAQVITIDNVSEPLHSPALAKVLTVESHKGRILGRSEMVSVAQRAVWQATGNNIRLRGDLPRRVFWVTLDPKVSRPQDRNDFVITDLIGWVVAHQGELLAALLTLCRGWYVAGAPKPEKTPTVGTFNGWAQTLGGIMEFYGLFDFLGNVRPCPKNPRVHYKGHSSANGSAGLMLGFGLFGQGRNVRDQDDADDETPQWHAFLLTWAEVYSKQPVTVAELAADVRANKSGLRDVLPDPLPSVLANEKQSFERSLSHALRKKQGARHGDENIYLERAGEDKKTKTSLWQVLR